MAAPGSATPEAFRARGLADVPSVGILAAGVPAAFGALVTALERWGTMPLKEVIAPAIALARNGFPVSDGLLKQHKYGIVPMQKRFGTSGRERPALPSRRARARSGRAAAQRSACAHARLPRERKGSARSVLQGRRCRGDREIFARARRACSRAKTWLRSRRGSRIRFRSGWATPSSSRPDSGRKGRPSCRRSR